MFGLVSSKAIALACLLEVIPVGMTDAAVAQPPSVLRRAISGIKSQESRVQTIVVRAQSRVLMWSEKAKRMEMANIDHLRAVFDGLPEGMCRVNVFKSLVASNGGPSPYDVSVYSFAYNGRVFTCLQTENGPFNSPITVSQGQISGNWPVFWGKTAQFNCGYAFSVFGFSAYFLHHNQGKRLSTVLESSTGGKRLPDGGIHGIITTAGAFIEKSGRRVIAITRTDGFGRIVLALNPAKADSIVKGTYFTWMSRTGTDGKLHWRLHRHPFTQFIVHGLFNPMAGVYFPKNVSWSVYESRQNSSGPYVTAEINVDRVRTNAPMPSLALTFPGGTVISDQSTGQIIHVGGTPQQQLKAIEKAVAAARKEVPTQPAVKGANQ